MHRVPLPGSVESRNAFLVYPRFPMTYRGFQCGLRLIGKRASLPPFGLPTVAGGGPAATSSPDLFPEAGVVPQGEVEGRIDELVGALDNRSGERVVLRPPRSYPDLKSVPVPRYDLLDLSKYASVSLQYSKSCPFPCEFCDGIEAFGRRPRIKEPGPVVSPRSYHRRCEAKLERTRPVSAKRAFTFGQVGALLRTIWHIGIRSPRRRCFRRSMVKAIAETRPGCREIA